MISAASFFQVYCWESELNLLSCTNYCFVLGLLLPFCSLYFDLSNSDFFCKKNEYKARIIKLLQSASTCGREKVLMTCHLSRENIFHIYS